MVPPPFAPSETMIAGAAEALLQGRCVVLPTDTVYGLAALLSRPDAIDQLFLLKGRPEGMPIAVLVAHRVQAEALADFTPLAVALADRWWPGPLTLVLAGRDDVATRVRSDAGTVGVRLPDHDLVRALARACVGPLATTSANLHGQPTPTTAVAIVRHLPVG